VGVTPHIKKSLDPEWNYDVSFGLTTCGLIYATLEIWDKDDFNANDLLASCRVPFILDKQCIEEGRKAIWCKLCKGPRVQGSILVYIYLAEDDVIALGQILNGMDVRDVFPPHNHRFQHVYDHIPRVWHPNKQCIIPSQEKIIHMVEEVSLTFHINESNQGVLALMVLSNFRLWFIPYNPIKGLMHEDVHTIAVGKILKAISTQTKRNQTVVHGLTIENMVCLCYVHYQELHNRNKNLQ